MTAAAVRVEQLLDELGDNADAVADRLRSLEIKGKRVSGCRCPIANYVRAAMPECGSIGATQRRVKFVVRDAAISSWEWVPTSMPVAEFIERFDRGVYLDLVEAVADA